MENPSIKIILDSFKKEKTLVLHDKILQWNECFDLIHVPLFIFSPDSQTFLQSFQSQYKSSLHYIHKDKSYFTENDYLKVKYIYGKSYRIIYPEIQLIYLDEIQFSSKRINNKTLREIFLKCMDTKYEKFKKNIEILLT